MVESPSQASTSIDGTFEKAEMWVVELIDEARNGAEWCSNRQTLWSRIYIVLGLPAAVLAAVAGATALASTTTRIVAGIIALVSAGLSAAVAFLDSRTKEERYGSLAAGWQALVTDLNVVLTFDLSNLENEIAERQLAQPNDADSIPNLKKALSHQIEKLVDEKNGLVAGKVPAKTHGT